MKRPTALELELAAAEAERRVINAAVAYAAAVEQSDGVFATLKAQGANPLQEPVMRDAARIASAAGDAVRKEAANLHACRTALMAAKYPGVLTGMAGMDPLRALVAEWRGHVATVRPDPATFNADDPEQTANDACAEAFDDCASELEHVLATFTGARELALEHPDPLHGDPVVDPDAALGERAAASYGPGVASNDCPTCQGYGVVGSTDAECPTCKGDGVAPNE